MKNNTHKNITNTSYATFSTYEKSRQKSTKTIRVTLRSCEISLYNILLKDYYYSPTPIILKYIQYEYYKYFKYYIYYMRKVDRKVPRPSE